MGYIILLCRYIILMCCMEIKSWDVRCIVKWYGIIDKETFEVVKCYTFQIPDANALSRSNRLNWTKLD